MPKHDVHSLLNWFKSHKRDLPWRIAPTPYAVWVSEVMLQQTQVAVVIPYFLNWMKLFPTVEALAKSSEDAVIKAWEGLGYYSRARNLHQGAQYVLEKHRGALPETREELLKIKGIGNYTVGAILSFAFHQKAAAVDGNVQRVVARLHGFEADLSKLKNQKTIQELCEGLLPDHEPWEAAEGLIELGAMVCTRAPRCLECPFKGSCQAFLNAATDRIPYKSAKIKTEKITRTVAIISSNGLFLLRKVPPGEIMEGLYEFPYFEGEGDPPVIASQIAARYSLKVDFVKKMAQVNHGFTRFQATLNPFLFDFRGAQTGAEAVQGYEWIDREGLSKIAFSSGHRKIFHALDAALVDD